MTKETERGGRSHCHSCKWATYIPDFEGRYYECGNPESDDYRHVISEYHSCNQYGVGGDQGEE